jgi:hypothetical protein
MIRAAGPVVRIGDLIMLTRREDVLAALRQPGVFSSRKAFDQMGAPLPLVPISFDPPEHTRYRTILQPYFSPRALAGMRPSLDRQARELVHNLAGRGGCDAIAEVAVPYPSQVFLTMFGLPPGDRDKLIGWKDAVLALATQPDPDPDYLVRALELFAYASRAVADRRANPGEDLLSTLLTAPDPLDDAEAVALCFVFVLAGLDTVTSSLGFALWKLATRPDLRLRLRAEPQRIGEFIEEMLRLESTAQCLPRVTTREVTIAGIDIAAETLVWLGIGAANREATAQDVELDGEMRRHWAFCSGPHRCLGSHLARLELRLVLTAWLTTIPDFELAPGVEPRIRFPSINAGFDSLPLIWPTTDHNTTPTDARHGWSADPPPGREHRLALA